MGTKGTELNPIPNNNGRITIIITHKSMLCGKPGLLVALFGLLGLKKQSVLRS